MNIVLLEYENLWDECAHIMSQSEPWITLQRNFEQCKIAISGENKEVYACVENSEIQGFVVLQLSGTFRGYIQTIAIKNQFQNKGLGTALLTFSEKRIFSISPNVFLCVSSFNSNAERLYQRLGYQKVGVLTDFIVKGHDEVLYRKTIGTISDFNKAMKRNGLNL